MHKLLFALLATVIAAGCSQKPSSEIKTVEWYKEHPVERKEQRKKCAESPDELTNNAQNCRNAETAAMSSLTGPNTSRIK